MSLRILDLGPHGHGERVDGRDERTGGRVYVDDAGLVRWYAYGDEPPAPDMGDVQLLNGLQEECEDVEPTLGSQTPADEEARRRALEHADAQGGGDFG